jgi:Tol biopolymer transport system component
VFFNVKESGVYRLACPFRLVWLTIGWGFLAITISLAGCAQRTNSSTSVVLPTLSSEPSIPPRMVGEPEGEIAFVGDDGNLWLLKLPSGQPQRLTENEHGKSPAWSPDGEQLAYVRKTDLNNQPEIVLLAVISQTRHVVQALQDPMLAAVSWSPDGRYLVGDVGCCATGRELVLLDSDGTQVQRRIPYSIKYTWSPDGRYLALGRDERLDQPISIESGNSSSVILLDTVSGVEQIVMQGTSEALYSPICWLSEQALVYRQLLWNEASQTGQDKLWQVTLNAPLKPVERTTDLPSDCTGSIAVTKLAAELREGVGLASWSPDKKWIVVSITKDGQPSIYLVQSSSYTIRRLGAGTEPVWRPANSR